LGLLSIDISQKIILSYGLGEEYFILLFSENFHDFSDINIILFIFLYGKRKISSVVAFKPFTSRVCFGKRIYTELTWF